MEGYFDEFIQLINTVPVDEMEVTDQLAVAMAVAEMIKKVNPIYQKYLFKDHVKKTFLMRINSEEAEE